ncbi:hypothetical protein FD16_GL000062 [Paucilactobacillus suebicus DSM 5007 = KCTC 3549]|uniref:Uncharacterized protein n=1 Tax=Paucilactobacillus suebicus DSM 5007 = KCTC 3549 TaxID=1423807 RepID=A0A0R1W724_9LACO|nr:hypothetical protein FD16_GL000062 [Paucilactobacillus suebicus DSM 5007 = KCTC 3549]
MNDRKVPEKQPIISITTIKPVEFTTAAAIVKQPTSNISVPHIKTAVLKPLLLRGSKTKNGLFLCVTRK